MSSNPPSSQTDKFEAGRDRIRETVKWLIASFGAIGASLALGTQISSIGKLHGWRLDVALAGAGLGFVGILAAMIFSVGVLTGAYVTFGELAAASKRARSTGRRSGLVKFFEDDNPFFVEPQASIEELSQEYSQAERQSPKRVQLSKRIAALMNAASYETLRRRFKSNLRWIVFSIAVSAIGILAFAWAANPGETAKSTTTSVSPAFIPVGANLSLTPAGRSLLKEDLGGKTCTNGDIPAIALGRVGNGIDVVALPRSRCRVNRITLNSSMGTLTPGTSVCAEKVRRPVHATSANARPTKARPTKATPTTPRSTTTPPTTTTPTPGEEDLDCTIFPG